MELDIPSELPPRPTRITIVAREINEVLFERATDLISSPLKWRRECNIKRFRQSVTRQPSCSMGCARLRIASAPNRSMARRSTMWRVGSTPAPVFFAFKTFCMRTGYTKTASFFLPSPKPNIENKIEFRHLITRVIRRAGAARLSQVLFHTDIPHIRVSNAILPQMQFRDSAHVCQKKRNTKFRQSRMRQLILRVSFKVTDLCIHSS